MDNTPSVQISSLAPDASGTSLQKAICPQCHQPVLPSYYFCPNCGKNLHEKPLSTTIWAQIWLYFFSLILMPLTCYLIYRYWQGIKYFRSEDPKARRIGIVSIILLLISIAFVVWSTWAGMIWLQQYIQAQESGMSGIGGGL